MPTKEVLRTGTFVDANGKKVIITEKTLEALVSNFNSEKSLNAEGYKVPLFLGHPADESTAPAHGWIKDIIKKGQFLVAEFEKLTDNAEKAIKNFSFRDVSVSVYKNILQHIGLTNTPAVSGLADFQYTVQHEDAEIWTFKQQKGDVMSEENNIKLAGEMKELEIKLTASEEKITELVTKLTEAEEKTEALVAEKVEAEKGKEDAEAKVEELETKIVENEKAAELASDTSFVEKLVEAGKMTPADKDATIENLSAYPKTMVGEKTAKDLYKESLSNLSKQIDEKEKFDKGESNTDGKLSRLIDEKMNKENLSHNDAMAIVLNENPELNLKGE